MIQQTELKHNSSTHYAALEGPRFHSCSEFFRDGKFLKPSSLG